MANTVNTFLSIVRAMSVNFGHDSLYKVNFEKKISKQALSYPTRTVHMYVYDLDVSRLNNLCLQWTKQPYNFVESVIGKVYIGEMFNRTLLTTLHQIFHKIIYNFKIIAKSIIDPDDNFRKNC